MKFPRQPVEETSVNLTPLIDVVFLLLIFFMVSTTFTKERELTVDLPEAEAQTAGELPRSIEVEISQEGEYAINGKLLVNRDPQTIRRALIDVAEGDTSVPFIIAADKNTPYQAVVTLMDVAGQLGFAQQSLKTQSPAD